MTHPNLDSAGKIFHVVQKAVAEIWPFSERAAREYYLARLGRIARAEAVLVLGFAIMDNHVHLLLFVPRSLETFMRRLATSFAKYYNGKRSRQGHVFGEVYFFKEVEGVVSFVATLRYILRNPGKAGLLRTLEQLACSDRTSYPSLIGESNLFAADSAIALRYFGDERDAAIAELNLAITSSDDEFDPLKEMKSSAEHAAWRRRKDAAKEAGELMSTRARLIREGWTLERAAEVICEIRGVSLDEVRGRSKEQPLPKIRGAIAHFASAGLGMPLHRIGEWFRVESSSVHRAIQPWKETSPETLVELPGGNAVED